jgi:hypothetical protein
MESNGTKPSRTLAVAKALTANVFVHLAIIQLHYQDCHRDLTKLARVLLRCLPTQARRDVPRVAIKHDQNVLRGDAELVWLGGKGARRDAEIAALHHYQQVLGFLGDLERYSQQLLRVKRSQAAQTAAVYYQARLSYL